QRGGDDGRRAEDRLWGRRSPYRRLGEARRLCGNDGYPLLPSKPRGFAMRTTAMRKNTTTMARRGKNSLAKESVMPTRSALQKAPSTFPSPPTTTTTSARRSMVKSRPGASAIIGAPNTPPKPASIAPNTNVQKNTRSVGTPKLAAMRGSPVAARIMAPQRVFLSPTLRAMAKASPTAMTNRRYAGKKNGPTETSPPKAAGG